MMVSKAASGCVFAVFVGVALLTPRTVHADEKKNAALSGAWNKKNGDLRLEFVDAKSLKIVPHGDSSVLSITCTYTVDKKGVVTAKISDLQGKEEATKRVKEHLPVGFTFQFKWRSAGAAGAKLEDIDGKDVGMLRSHLEGEFEQKK